MKGGVGGGGLPYDGVAYSFSLHAKCSKLWLGWPLGSSTNITFISLHVQFIVNLLPRKVKVNEENLILVLLYLSFGSTGTSHFSRRNLMTS